MRWYKVNKFKYVVYDSLDEVPSHITIVKDWREGEVGDWVLTDDECVVQIIRKSTILHCFVKTCCCSIKTNHRVFLVE